MSWLRLHRRAALLIALTLVLPLLLYLKLLFGALSLGFDYAAQRERMEPRAARLEGLVQQESLVSERRDAAREALARLVYPGTEDAPTLAAALQTEVRRIFSDAGLTITNSQVLPARAGDDFDRVAVKLTVSGSLPALDAALSGIAAVRPQLLIESLDVYPQPAGRGVGATEQVLGAVIQVLALRAVG